jgi:hypothetical protein
MSGEVFSSASEGSCHTGKSLRYTPDNIATLSENVIMRHI